jgi:hypothetical protein
MTERMRVPCRASAWFEDHLATADPHRRTPPKPAFDAPRAREVLGRANARSLGAGALHDDFLVALKAGPNIEFLSETPMRRVVGASAGVTSA